MKPWWRSRTLWGNLLLFVVALVDVAAGTGFYDAALSALTSTPVEGAEQAAVPLTAANIALRLVTRAAVTWGGR